MTQLLKNITINTGELVFLESELNNPTFEKNYLDLRSKEGRIFSDDHIKLLPYLLKSHKLHDEWLYRADTQKRFCNYIHQKKEIKSVLDIGCGNGWFSNCLSKHIPGSKIIGIDVNRTELEQAHRLFSNENLVFVYGDIFKDHFNTTSFDLIVLNSVVQYFHNFDVLIKRLLELLADNGEIHILDSPLYKNKQKAADARQRSLDYFTRMGVAEMANHYHHHECPKLNAYNTKMMYDPNSAINNLKRKMGLKSSPFPWVRIKTH